MADEHTLGAELVTPESALFAGEAVAVVCRTSEGDLTVLAGHTQLVGDLVPGVVRIELAEGSTLSFCVHGGFLQVDTSLGAAVGLIEGAAPADRTTRVTLLAGVAEPVSAIDVARAQASRDAAAAVLASLAAREDEEARLDREQAQRSLARAELRLEVTGATATSQ